MTLLIPLWLKADSNFYRSCHKKDLHRQKFTEFLSNPPESHFHNFVAHGGDFPVQCVECHLAHKRGNSKKHFLIKLEVFKACTRCHPNWTKQLEQYF